MRAAVTGIVARIAAVLMVGVALAATGDAEDAGSDGRGLTAAWRLDRLTLDDGRSLAGLLLEEPDDPRGVVAFVEVVRRPGRPMHLVTRRLPARLVASVDRLSDADRQTLAARIEAFRTSGRAEREAAAALKLSRRDDGAPWRYEGESFTLESSAGQPLTRQAIVRLEALLDAFERLVPAAADPASAAGASRRRLAVRLCGSQAEYARAQAEQGVKVANPAFYLPERGLLVAGSDVPGVIEQARLAADGLDATDPRRLARLAALLAAEPRGLLGPVIDGGEAQFVVGHGNAAATSRRAYLLAWGLAYDLVLGSPALAVQGIEQAARHGGAERSGPAAGDERARFERLVGMPIDEFEAAWRGRMLALARGPGASH